MVLVSCGVPGGDMADEPSAAERSLAAKKAANSLNSHRPQVRILFFGDSITKAGTSPDGYVSLVGEGLPDVLPGKDVEVLASGVSGDTVSDLQARIDRDVFPRDPTHVFIYIGVNEVGQRRSSSRIAAGDRRSYRNGLLDIMERVKGAGARPFLCTPAVFGDNPDSGSNANKLLDEYAAISREVAAQAGASVCDLRTAFREFLRAHNPDRRNEGVVTVDGVHLNEQGNRLVAREILKTLAESEGSQAP